LGTGFFVDEAAHVVTAKHVIDGGRELAQAAGQPPVFTVGLAAPNRRTGS
jgi:S1-C subfamily serine protease